VKRVKAPVVLQLVRHFVIQVLGSFLLCFPQKNRLFTRGNNYYYRRRIPAFLINYFKPKTFVISLKTSTLSDAKKLAACYDVKFDSLATQHVMHGLQLAFLIHNASRG
jgi:hypothetical protein